MATPPSRRRAPLAERNAATRTAARARLRARITRPVTEAQRAIDPFSGHHPAVVALGGGIAGAAALHAAVVLGGLWAGQDRDEEQDRVATPIEVRERTPTPPPPEPPPPEQVPEPVPEPVAEVPIPRPVARVDVPQRKPEPTEVIPPDPPKKPPPRVIGLNLDSTQAGGDGPSFAVGNTLGGQTAQRAADPTAVVPGATGPIEAMPDKPPPGPNQVASRIPTVGAKIVLPKRRKPATLVYPEVLKAQGIEADVTVIVNVDATGKPVTVKIAKGSGYPALDEAARKAALGEAFDPATRDGVAMPYTLSFTYRFRLEDQ